MEKAFVLGAGLGTRLRPLTEHLPKPLVPVFHRPLITYAFDHLASIGVDSFVVNTHHCPDAYGDAFPGGAYQNHPITLRHEPILLETAGGIANVADLFADQLRAHGSFFVYNGDILTDLPLARAAAQHQASGDAVTLILRSTGPALHIAFDPDTNKATDVRNMLGTGQEGSHQFTGIYIVGDEFVGRLTPGKKESVIPHFLDLMRESRVGAVVENQGIWLDLGTRDSYLDAHHVLSALNGFDAPSVHPNAKVHPSAIIDPKTIVGPDAVIGADAKVESSILWPHSKVDPGTQLIRCIVRTGQSATGSHSDTDF